MKEAELYTSMGDGRVKCTACARHCTVAEGQIGLCGIRQNLGGKLQLLSYGKLFTGHIDPIEKKPVTHYRPGSRIFSVATSGCSWLCRYCFCSDTPILTNKGMIEIEKLYQLGHVVNPGEQHEVAELEGVRAVSHTGKFQKIEAAFKHYYKGDLLAVTPLGLQGFKCTPDHKVLATIDPLYNPQMIRADELHIGSYLMIPKLKEPEIADTKEVVESIPLSHALNGGGKTVLLVSSTTNHSSKSIGSVFAENRRFGVDSVEWEELTRRIKSTDNYILIPIRKIERTPYEGPVYNLQVEEDHTYTASCFAVSNCQNYDISQRRKIEGFDIQPVEVPRLATSQDCQGIAYTYNEPSIFIEFARDIGLEAHKKGLFNIFVSNGYDTAESVSMMSEFLDCITVDFKGSGETNFVRKYIGIPNADPIFETLSEIKRKTRIHVEITDLIVPGVGDSLAEARKLSRWVRENLGPETPIHFLRFHPDYKMMEFPNTPVKTLEKHHAVAKEEGLEYAYLGNVPGHPLENTYCPSCGGVVVKRCGYDIKGWYLDKDNNCASCGFRISIEGKLDPHAGDERFLPAYF